MSDVVVVERTTVHNRSQDLRVRYFIFSGVLVLVFGALLGLTVWLRPTLLVAYNIERAGRLMDLGLSWPEPHVLDSLPMSRDDAALQQALGHLAAAIRWQPDSAYAYRLVARIYAAQQAWSQAAEAIDTAQVLDENNQVLAWERALVYEQLWRQLSRPPGEPVVSAFEQAEVVAPPTPIETPFCSNGRPESCYSARTAFAQSLATRPDSPEIAADVIFLHPPAELRLAQAIPQAQSTLFFLIGLDPRAREWGSDGADFQVLIQDADGQTTPVYEATLDADTARRGWTAATADLAPWAGKTVTLILRATAGSAHNTTADWFGWGNLTLLTAGQARLALLAPEAYTREAWAKSGIDPSTFRARAEEALQRNQYAAALSWDERDRLANNQNLPENPFLATVAMLMSAANVPSELLASSEFVHRVTGPTRIESEMLRWTTTGELLFAGAEPSTHVLLTVGDAVAVVQIEQADTYRVIVRAQDTPPAPVTFQIERDFKRLGQFSMTRGDMLWQEFAVETELSVGAHIIGLRYLNDAFINGADRNLVVDWLQIEPVR